MNSSPISQNRAVVAMSGGVDSSVAAHLLKERGYEVIGVTIKTWSSDECRDEKSKGCCSLRDIDDARSVARRLEIPHYVLDLSAGFKEKVMDYFVDEYFKGRTPNPCIECNNHIKFGMLLDKAVELQAGWVATGHYARKGYDDNEKRHFVREGLDLSKDQSYVLFGLNQAQLSKTLLPIGELEKKEVRQLAALLGLRVHDKPDSQEICFVPKSYGDFVKRYSPERLPGPGVFLDKKGKVIGRHEGSHLFTVGQRKRIRIPSPKPYFVAEIRPKSNEVVVGEEQELYAGEMTVRRMNWQAVPRLGEIRVKIRSRGAKSEADIVSIQGEKAVIRFKTPQKAVTPGQAAVLYDGDRVAGGGWIEKANLSLPKLQPA